MISAINNNYLNIEDNIKLNIYNILDNNIISNNIYNSYLI